MDLGKGQEASLEERCMEMHTEEAPPAQVEVRQARKEALGTSQGRKKSKP